jgi:hypothetical protein
LNDVTIDFENRAIVSPPEETDMAFLQVEGLCKSFGGLMAIRDLDFSVEERQIVGCASPLDDPAVFPPQAGQDKCSWVWEGCLLSSFARS